MALKFDLICLGTGPASSTVATACAKRGMNVAIIESREFGGTCALRGCNPKKVFTNAAALSDQFHRARGRLARGEDARIEWSDLVAFQHEFTDPVRDLTEERLHTLGIHTVHGFAQFEHECIVRVGETLLEAENIFIGVGARPNTLGIPGEDLVVTSDDFMELGSLPSRVMFLGGGFISFEFANLAARAGSNVKIVDRNVLPLKSFDPDLVRLLIKCSEAAGIEVFTETEAISVTRSGNALQVTLQTTDGETTGEVDLVVNGGGRVPNLDGLNLEAGRVAFDKRGIKVNEFLQSTTNAAVYAAGDCADTGVQMLTPTANESALVAASNLSANRQHKAANEIDDHA
jgi:glutathione reductase (NADPH)